MDAKTEELIFEQDYIKSRVVKTDEGYDIEFAILGGPSIGVTEENELVAKSIYAGLDAAYRALINEAQERMVEALEKLIFDCRQPGLSEPKEHQ